MVADGRTIEILDPCPEDVPEEVGLSRQLSSLEGKVVGLLENRKHHADSFLQELQKVLEQEYGAKKVVYNTKFSFSTPCAEDILNAMVEECDAVVHAIAD